MSCNAKSELWDGYRSPHGMALLVAMGIAPFESASALIQRVLGLDRLHGICLADDGTQQDL